MVSAEELVMSTHSIDGTKLYISYGKAFVSRSLAILYAEKQARQVSLDKQKAEVEERFARKAEPALRNGLITSPYRAYIGDGKVKSPSKAGNAHANSPSGRGGGFAAGAGKTDVSLEVSTMTASAVMNLERAMEAVKQISQAAASRMEPSVRHAATSPLPMPAPVPEPVSRTSAYTAQGGYRQTQLSSQGEVASSSILRTDPVEHVANSSAASASSKLCERCGRLERRIHSLERTLQASTEAIEGLQMQMRDRNLAFQAAQEEARSVERNLQRQLEAAAAAEKSVYMQLLHLQVQSQKLQDMVEARRDADEAEDMDLDADQGEDGEANAEAEAAPTAPSSVQSSSPHRSLAARPPASHIVTPYTLPAQAAAAQGQDQDVLGASPPLQAPSAPEAQPAAPTSVADGVRRRGDSLETPPRPQSSSAMAGTGFTVAAAGAVSLSVLQSPLPKSPPLPSLAGPSSISSAGSRASSDARSSPAASVQPSWPSPPLPALPPAAESKTVESPSALSTMTLPVPAATDPGRSPRSGRIQADSLHIRSPQAPVAALLAQNPFDTPTDSVVQHRGSTGIAVDDILLRTPPRSGSVEGRMRVQGRAISFDGAVPASSALSSIYNMPGTPTVLGVALCASSPLRAGLVGRVGGVPSSPGMRAGGPGVLGAVLGLPMALGAASGVSADSSRLAASPARPGAAKDGSALGTAQEAASVAPHEGEAAGDQGRQGAGSSASLTAGDSSSNLDDSVRI